MTSVEIIGIIGAVGVLVGGLVAGVVSILRAFAEFRATVNRVDAKADVIAATAAKIDGHVNSEKTAGEGRENTLRAEIALLREVLSDKKATASLLAQAAAGASTTVVHTTNGAVDKPLPEEPTKS